MCWHFVAVLWGEGPCFCSARHAVERGGRRGRRRESEVHLRVCMRVCACACACVCIESMAVVVTVVVTAAVVMGLVFALAFSVKSTPTINVHCHRLNTKWALLAIHHLSNNMPWESKKELRGRAHMKTWFLPSTPWRCQWGMQQAQTSRTKASRQEERLPPEYARRIWPSKRNSSRNAPAPGSEFAGQIKGQLLFGKKSKRKLFDCTFSFCWMMRCLPMSMRTLRTKAARKHSLQ